MAQFHAFSDKVEVNGETVLSIVNGIGVFKKQALEILAKYDIQNPKPGQWYNQQAWLNSFKEISVKIGPKSLFAIGKAIPSSANFPESINSIQKALEAIDIAYHMNHKGGEIGHYKYVKSEGRTAKVICDNPYPCDFDRGIIEAMAQKFKPADAVFALVEYDDTKLCRKKGADSCTYLISW